MEQANSEKPKPQATSKPQPSHQYINRSQTAPKASVFIAHPFQKDNPALRNLGFKFDYNAELHIDIVVRGLDVGILYLDASYHIKNETQLEKRLEFVSKGSRETRGTRQYVAFIMDHKESHDYIPSVSILCCDFSIQLLPMKSTEDFRVYLQGLNRQSLPLLHASSIAYTS